MKFNLDLIIMACKIIGKTFINFYNILLQLIIKTKLMAPIIKAD